MPQIANFWQVGVLDVVLSAFQNSLTNPIISQISFFMTSHFGTLYQLQPRPQGLSLNFLREKPWGRGCISQVPRPSPFRQTWTLRDVTERDVDWHRSFIRLFSDNEARENAWGLGWGGIIYNMACGIHLMGTSWPAIYSINYKFKKMGPRFTVRTLRLERLLFCSH